MWRPITSECFAALLRASENGYDEHQYRKTDEGYSIWVGQETFDRLADTFPGYTFNDALLKLLSHYQTGGKMQ